MSGLERLSKAKSYSRGRFRMTAATGKMIPFGPKARRANTW